MAKAGLAYQVRWEAGGWEAIKTYAAAGFGVAVVPSVCLTTDDRRRLATRDASKLFGKDHYGGVVRKGGYLPRSARELIRLIDPGFPHQRGPRGIARLGLRFSHGDQFLRGLEPPRLGSCWAHNRRGPSEIHGRPPSTSLYLRLKAPRAGLEPATLPLTAGCSTIELPGNKRMNLGGKI